jgi:hypothetical protein
MISIKLGRGKKRLAAISNTALRRMIGVLGLSLPLVLFTWSVFLTKNHFLLDSISSYYHTDLRYLFVGILCAVSLLLFAYPGYDSTDFIASKVASIAVLGIAFFPAYIRSPINPYIDIAPNVSSATNTIHYLCAAVFFTALAMDSLFLFTRTGPMANGGKGTLEKRRRNLAYRICGLMLFICPILMVIVDMLPPESGILRIKPAFWLETLSLFAFGFSWLVKGEVLLKDKAPARLESREAGAEADVSAALALAPKKARRTFAWPFDGGAANSAKEKLSED